MTQQAVSARTTDSAVIVSVDLGTTKITSLAVDAASGCVIAQGTVANDANVTSPEDRSRGRSEWDAKRIIVGGLSCLRQVAEKLGGRMKDVAGIGVTGQQHGMVLTTPAGEPVSPLINWQDRRALDCEGSGKTFLDTTRDRLGVDAWRRTGCRLQPGFMAMTLLWLRQHQELPANVRVCFIMDSFGATLTGQPPITEPSCAGSSGVFNVRTRDWDDESLLTLELPREIFPEVREADQPIGQLCDTAASATGLPRGTPVFAPIGDHQASFLGSVTNLKDSVLVNVGTGAQVAVFTNGLEFKPPIELRPFPCGGNLLSNVGLAGGWSYQVLEHFFRDVGQSLFATESPAPLYDLMNRLAESVPAGANGLRCEPLFNGTRLDPTVRGTITGLSPQNFSARHFARAVLEGMGRSLHEGFLAIHEITGHSPAKLIAAGNGLRENPLLAEMVSTNFGLPITWTEHREEAAYGAARVAMKGLGWN